MLPNELEIVKEILRVAKRHHFELDEDPWYNCPESEYGCINETQVGCNCGATLVNNKLQKLAISLGIDNANN